MKKANMKMLAFSPMLYLCKNKSFALEKHTFLLFMAFSTRRQVLKIR